MKKQFIIFDIEVTPVAQFLGIKIGNKIKHVSLLDRASLVRLLNLISSQKYILVGFNNYKYDNKILNYCISQQNLTSQDIINFSNSIINKTAKVKGNEFNIYVPDLKYGSTIENLDVFSMMGQKASLKLSAFKTYQYLFTNALASETLDDLKRYNKEDLSLTERLFYDEFEQEYELNLYLSKYLGFGEIGHKNLIISKFLKEIAKYNDEFSFRSCLDNAKLDEDLKYLAEKLIGNNKLTELYTVNKILIKKGGIHFPIDYDFSKLGVQYYKECYNYDFSSYYPNLYINLLDFFSPETKAYLENILGERLQAKKDGDEQKNKALKLFINSVYGQLKNINKEYMYAVAIMGQVLFVQLMRDNNITLKDVVEVNTDGILLKNKLENIKNISNIEIEEEVFTDIYHKNSNNKTYKLNGKPVVKGTILGNNEHTEKLVFKDLKPCLYGGAIYNCFIVKHKNQSELDPIKYYKFKNLDDIKNYSLGHGGILMAKKVFNEAVESGVLVEISEYNYEDITPSVTDLFNDYLKENEGYERYIDSDFELKSKSEDLNNLYDEYKDKLYLLPSDKDICILVEDKLVHNELTFYQNQEPKNLFVVPADEFIIVEVNHGELANKKIKELLTSNTAKYFIYKKPSISIKTRALKGLKYYKDLKIVSISSVDEVELIEAVLPQEFYNIVSDEQVPSIDYIGMTKEALKEKARVIRAKINAENKQLSFIENAKAKNIPILIVEELEQQFNEIYNFLATIDPSKVLRDSYTGSPAFVSATELRSLQRDGKNIKSTAYYSLLNQKFIEDLEKNYDSKYDRYDLKTYLEYINGKAYCSFYSVFTFEPMRDEKTNRIDFKVKNENAKYTMALPMDFDNIGEEEYKEIKQRFTALGLETLDIFSGHGYQMIILINQKCYDKNVLNMFTNLLYEKGFPVDKQITDPARIMRLPNTYNCKCLDKNSKYYGKEEPIFTRLVNKTGRRYNINDVFIKLLSLESVEPQLKEIKEVEVPRLEEVKIKEVEVPRSEEVKIKEVEVPRQEEVKINDNKVLDFIEHISLSNNKLKKLQDLYANTRINILELEPVIQNILFGTREGMRHDVILFIMPYLKNYKKYTQEEIEDILIIWGKQSKMLPSEIKTQVRSLYSYEKMTAPYGIYSDNLKREYGVFKLATSKNQVPKLCITNDLIKNLDKLPNKALKLYMALMLVNQETGENIFTIDDLVKITKFSRRTIYRSKEYLIKHKYMTVNKRCKQKGEKYLYSLNLNILNFNKTKFGFIAISQNIFKKALENLTTGELYNWLYISMCQGTSNKVCDLNQYVLGSKTNRSNTAVSNITTNLAKKGFMSKATKWRIIDVSKNIYEQYCLYDVTNKLLNTSKLAS